MKFLPWTVYCTVCLVLLCGCGRDEPAAPPATQPATAPAPQPATLTVGGEPVTFATPSLSVTRDGKSLAVTLSGVDARQSFYFTCQLEGDSPDELPGKSWRFKQAEGEEVDGAVGVFMEGAALRFLPRELAIDFAGDWPELTVTIAGKLLRDGDESKPVSLSGVYRVRGTEAAR